MLQSTPCSTRPAGPCSAAAGRNPAAQLTPPPPPARLQRRRRTLARAGEPLGSQEKLQPFDEGAAQVARLLARDKRELLGDDVAEFIAASDFADDEAGPATSAAAAAAPGAKKPTTLPLAPPAFSPPPASPFGTPPPASPFGGISFGTGVRGGDDANPNSGSLFTEAEDFNLNKGDGGPPLPWYAGVSLSQALIALSFLLVIALMLVTFAFVFKVGAIRFNE